MGNCQLITTDKLITHKQMITTNLLNNEAWHLPGIVPLPPNVGQRAALALLAVSRAADRQVPLF